jgi:CTP synthase
VIITEIGGTVGDIESLPFLEAIRQVAAEVGRQNVIYIHVTLIPYLSKSGELKTKPTQHSVKELLSIGIQPDIIVLRTEKELSDDIKAKIGLFCNVNKESVIQNLDADSLYEVPLMLEEEGLAMKPAASLGSHQKEGSLRLDSYGGALEEAQQKGNHRLVGKYVELHDAYISVAEACVTGHCQ